MAGLVQANGRDIRAAVHAPDRSPRRHLLVLESDHEMRRLLGMGLKEHFFAEVLSPESKSWRAWLADVEAVLVDLDRAVPDDPDPREFAIEVLRRRPDLPVLGVSRERSLETIRAATEIGMRTLVGADLDPRSLREVVEGCWQLADRQRWDLTSRDRPRLGELWALVKPTAAVRHLELLLGMAEVLTQSGLKVLVVEASSQRGELARLTGLGPDRPGLMELCGEGRDLPLRSTVRFAGRAPAGYQVLPYRNSPVTYDVSADFVTATLLGLADQVDVLLVDLPPADQGAPEALLALAHRIVIVTGPEDVELRGFEALRDGLTSFRELRPRLVPVFTGWQGDPETRDAFLAQVFRQSGTTSQIFPAGPAEAFSRALRQLLPALIPPQLSRGPLRLKA